MAEFLRLFERVVRERGSAAAVVARDETLSFAQLGVEARRLAGDLRAAGVREGDVVGLSLGRTSRHVAGILGAWAAGAAFLPIDPSAPPDRVARMLEEARVRVVLEAVEGRRAIRRLAGTRAPLDRTHDDLAYVIYTSGSTGRPKGVRVGHRGLCPVLLAQIDAFGLGPRKRVLFCLSTAFDASISDIGTSLLSGATLVVTDEALTPATLVERIRADAITHADLPPAILPLVDPPSLPPSLETVVIGGEVCPAYAVRAWARRLRVVNVYGPTEATICTSLVACDADRWASPSIGAPLPHVEYAVEDGELLIAGPALALGYVDRPDLEAERFVERAGKRWYRTGDRVRPLEDGTLAFVGRIDRQVKIRGRLVCPEEIEAHLRAMEDVVDARVDADDDDERVVLHARVVPRTASLTTAAIRGRLEAALPPWMIPPVALVSGLERGINGKIAGRATDGEPLVDPRVRAVARAFAAVLRVETVGADDDVVALGGDSVAALEIAALAQLRGLAIEPDTILAARTPRGIAAARPAPPRTVADLGRLADALAKEVTPAPATARGEDWLVTGATGFLGSRLAAEILTRTTARIHCVVRAASDADARARLGGLGAHDRIVAHAGDVTAPRLGMGDASWLDLTRRVGNVVHAAATLSLSLPFAALEATNVRGALEVARFVTAGAPKTLHHVSSLAVLASTDLEDERLDERTAPPPETRVAGAYAQTKWVAEALLRRAVPDARVIRPGLMTGDSRTGVGAPTCPLASFLRAAALLGCLPVADDGRLRVDVTPVDRAARAIAIAVTGPSCPPVLHVASEHGASLADLVRALGRRAPVERVSREEFLARLRRDLSRDTALALVASSYRLLGADVQRGADLFLHTGRTFSCEALASVVGRPLEAVDEALLARYASRAIATPPGATP